MAVMAILRKNLFENKNTQIVYTSELPQGFDADIIKNVYGYTFQLTKVVNETAIPAFNGSTIFISQQTKLDTMQLHGDRKSTRLNSSHVKISYAVFCLK